MLGVVLGMILLIGGGFWLVVKATAVPNVEADPGAKVSLSETNKDWGEIKMSEGIVKASFTVKNGGDQTL